MKTTRTIVVNGPSIVSIRPNRTGKAVTAGQCGLRYNVLIDTNMVLTIEGGHPFRICGWISGGKYFPVLTEGRVRD